jgi:hypothetical protein
VTARPPIRADRVRRIGAQSFAFIPHRLLRGGFLASMTHRERSLYLFLVLVADRNSISFYGYDRICSTLEMTLDDYIAARNGLIDKDLLAFDGTRFQVLSLPSEPAAQTAGPLHERHEIEDSDPATIRQCILDGLDDRAESR